VNDLIVWGDFYSGRSISLCVVRNSVISSPKILISSWSFGRRNPIDWNRAFSSLKMKFLSQCSRKWHFESSWLILTFASAGICRNNRGKFSRYSLLWAIASVRFISSPIIVLFKNWMFLSFNFSIEILCLINSSKNSCLSLTSNFFLLKFSISWIIWASVLAATVFALAYLTRRISISESSSSYYGYCISILTK
jgi:hypothetical protein